MNTLPDDVLSENFPCLHATLYTLVRTFCRIALPILWRRPFWIPSNHVVDAILRPNNRYTWIWCIQHLDFSNLLESAALKIEAEHPKRRFRIRWMVETILGTLASNGAKLSHIFLDARVGESMSFTKKERRYIFLDPLHSLSCLNEIHVLFQNVCHLLFKGDCYCITVSF